MYMMPSKCHDVIMMACIIAAWFKLKPHYSDLVITNVLHAHTYLNCTYVHTVSCGIPETDKTVHYSSDIVVDCFVVSTTYSDSNTALVISWHSSCTTNMLMSLCYYNPYSVSNQLLRHSWRTPSTLLLYVEVTLSC